MLVYFFYVSKLLLDSFFRMVFYNVNCFIYSLLLRLYILIMWLILVKGGVLMRLSIKVFYFYFDFVDCFFLIGNIIYC